MNDETLMTNEAATTTEGEYVQDAETSVSADQQQGAESTSTQANAHGEASDAKPEGAPERYELSYGDQAPDAEISQQFESVARELNLSQDQAQAFLSKMLPSMQERTQAQLAEAREHWAQEARNDREFGGESLNGNLAVAKRAMDTFGTPELAKLLNESGLGNHPEVIRVFYRAGKAISEDGFVTGRGVGNYSSDPAKRLFPSQA